MAARAERELDALVAVSSPSGDRHGAEDAVAVAGALLPAGASVERLTCSSPEHADDLLARVSGSGRARLLLLGHLDTVFAHADHRPLGRDGPRLTGAGTIDMKGGVVLALGVMRALAASPRAFAEVALLLVVDEEWRTAPFAHSQRFAGWDACLCFEAGQRTPDGEEAVVVRRKAAGTLRVSARGVAAHSGSAPDRGRNALVALAQTAGLVVSRHDPTGPQRLTAVPTIMHSGEAFNVVPAGGELLCDLRADRVGAFQAVADAIPDQVEGVSLDTEMVRVWPGMDSRAATTDVLAGAGERLGRAVIGAARGGASDASHLAAAVPVTIDGLGPRGGGAHSPREHVLADSLHTRAEVALAVAAALVQLD